MGSRFSGFKRRTKSIPLRTYYALAGYIPEEVVVPLPFMLDPCGSTRWPYSIRSAAEKKLPGEEASLMEQMRLDEKLLRKIKERSGKKDEKLIKVCYRCFGHELGYRTKGFKKIVAEVFRPRAAFEYSYKQLVEKKVKGLGRHKVSRKRRIYGVVFEQTQKIKYGWNKKEISIIELTTSRRFKSILTSQMLQLIPPKPSEHRENLEWLVSRVVDLNFDFGPYTLPLRSIYRKGAKGIYPMPLPSRNHDNPVDML